MAIDLKKLAKHPHLNPEYFPVLKARREAQLHNASIGAVNGILSRRPVKVPRLVNKYLPHTGLKEQNRGKS